jgi:hypothetical protein
MKLLYECIKVLGLNIKEDLKMIKGMDLEKLILKMADGLGILNKDNQMVMVNGKETIIKYLNLYGKMDN